MYAVYTHDASTSQANLVNDIVLILTGTTNTASLSADCVTGSSSISTTYAVAGWTLHDAAGGSNLQIIKALQQDGVTYKYVGIQATSTTAFSVVVYEDWDEIGHSGTNGVTSNSITWSSSTQQPFYIYATQQAIVITCYSGVVYYSPCVALEVDNTLGTFIAGYPTTFTFKTANDISEGTGPRIKNPKAAGDLTTTSTFFMSSPNADNSGSSCKGFIFRDATETVQMALLTPVFHACTAAADTNYGAFGKLLGNVKFGNCLASPVTQDTASIGGATYVAIYVETGGSNLGTSMWVKQG